MTTDYEFAQEIKRLRESADQLRGEIARTPSKAHLIGPGFAPGVNADNFFVTLAMANSNRLSGSYDASIAAKARLDEWGSTWQDPDPAAKATIGDTDAPGGYLGLPADFLIDAQGKLLHVKYGSHADDHWEVDDVLRLVQA